MGFGRSVKSLRGMLPVRIAAARRVRDRIGHLCAEVFAEVDHNCNGKLDSAEFHIAVLRVYGQLNATLKLELETPTMEKVKAMLTAADTSGDEQLDCNEFTR